MQTIYAAEAEAAILNCWKRCSKRSRFKACLFGII